MNSSNRTRTLTTLGILTAIILVMSSDVLKAYTYGSQPGVMLKEL